MDVHVGSRIRLRRLSLGLSQEDLAASLEVTAATIDSLENGAPVSAGRLSDIAKSLTAPVKFFFCSGSVEKMEAVQAAKNDKGLLTNRERQCI